MYTSKTKVPRAKNAEADVDQFREQNAVVLLFENNYNTVLRAFLLFLATSSEIQETSKPHIIVILTDDLGWNAPGYNNPDLITPTLDSLASTGVKFTSHYVYRYCSPTRFGAEKFGRKKIIKFFFFFCKN